MKEIWILGATGRTGSVIAKALVDRGLDVVVVGRDERRLKEVAPGARIFVAESTAVAATEIEKRRPAVVMNTVGPFVETAGLVAQACMAAGAHYVDLSNELPAVRAILDLDEGAKKAGSTLVAASGYGVLGTEAIVLKLCHGEPKPKSVRVAAIPRIGGSGTALGEALAASIVEGLAEGGKAYVNGRLVRAVIGRDSVVLTLPDGDVVATTGGAPVGDLESAHRASGAPNVIAASSELPSGAMARVMLPVISSLARSRAMGHWMKRQMANMKVPPPKKEREFSWSHARVEWEDGRAREGWLKAPEGMEFTTRIATEVIRRLANNEGRPGAFTPGALFGPDLALVADAEFITK